MQYVNPSYAQALTSRTKKPIWLVSFASVPTRYSSALFLGPAAATKDYLTTANSSFSGTITVDAGSSSVGDFTFSILDKNQEITAMLARYVIQGQQVTVKQGFAGLSEAQFVTVFQGQVSDYRLDTSNLSYTFVARSNLKLLDQNFMSAQTTTLAGMLVGDTTMNAAAFAGPTDRRGFASATGAGPISTGNQLFYLLVDQEVIAYTGYTMLAQPPAASLAVVNSGGSLTAATYYVAVTKVTATGETQAGVEASVVIASGVANKINVTIPAFAAPVTGYKIYVSTYAGGEQLSGTFSTGAGGTFAITAMPSTTSAYAPGANTTGQFTGLSRGQYNTVAATHAQGATVTQFMVIQDSPMNIVLKMMTSTGAGTNGTYDVLPASCGLGIAQALVDVAGITTQGNTWLYNYTMLFELFSQENCKSFLESEIFQLVNAYATVTANGLISVHVYAPPLPILSMVALTDDNLVGLPTWGSSLMARYFYNEVKVSVDYVWSSKTWSTLNYYESLASQATYDLVSTKTFTSRGLRTAVTTAARMNILFSRFLKRFAVPSPEIDAVAFFATRQAELGDVVSLTSKTLPDLVKGVRGISGQLMEVVQLAPDFNAYQNKFVLLATGYASGQKFGCISPSAKAPTNFPNYSSATANQRLYAFIGTKVSNTKGIMPDGADAYYVTP